MTQYARYPITAGSSGGSSGSGNQFAFASGAPFIAVVTAVSLTIAPANAARLFLRVSNYSTENVWLQYGALAVVGRGMKLSPNSIFEISSTELYTGSVHAISGGATVDVDVFEGTA